MPAQSKSQQRFFGVVKAMQKGDIPKKGRAGKIAKQMSKKDVDDFASTKHKGKPEKVKREQRVRELIKKMVREELSKMNEKPFMGGASKSNFGMVKPIIKAIKKKIFGEFEPVEETTVRISTMKDVSFAGRDRLQLVGKKGKLGLDRKSVSALVKAVRSALGRSFTTHEQKLNEAKTITLPNGVKAKIEFKGITLQAKGKKPVFLDRTEMMTFFKATQKYMKQGLTAGKMSEGKLNEKVQKYVVGLDNGEVISGDKAVSEKKAHQIMTRISDRSDGWVNPFMIGVEAWNGTHPKSKGKPHKMNKKKIMVKEGTCGYGENGQLGEEPAGPHLIKKKKIKESGRNIAKTILQQLGGNKFIAMTGAKNLGFTNNGLQMKIGRNSKGITHVIISLKSTDTYDVEFIKMRGVNRKVVKKLKGVYADQLGKIFTKFTGLRTRL